MQRRRLLQLGACAAIGALTSPLPAMAKTPRRVVIVGAGFAGATCALTLRRLDPSIDVSIVDPEPHYISCPRSNAVIGGLRTLESLTISRRGLEQAGITVVRDAVVAIDTDRRRARLRGGRALRYDRLVFAGGIRLRWDAIPGYDEAASQQLPHAWKAGTQTIVLARQLRELRSGGVVAISVPPLPYRCPPGPYERASLIANFLKTHNPRAKILVFDANNRFSKQPLFEQAWQSRYAGLIEWIAVTDGGAVERVDASTRTLHTASGAHRVDIANVIPPQAPAALAVEAGLATANGWCPVNMPTFESKHVAGVHVIGDACIADAMPKSASSANSQGKHCAIAIIEAFAGREGPPAVLHNTCYSLVSPDAAVSVSGIYRVRDGVLHEVSGGMSPVDADATLRADEAAHAEAWYQRIVADSFAV